MKQMTARCVCSGSDISDLRLSCAAVALERVSVYCVVERFVLSKDILSFINYDWCSAYIRRYVADRVGIYCWE